MLFNSGNANAITASDSDGGSSTESVTVTATSGTVTLGSTANITISNGTGTNDASVTFSGTLAQLNTALSGLRYTPASNFFGTGGIAVSLDDQSSNPGGPLSAAGDVAINVSEVFNLTNSHPVYAVNEDASLAVSAPGTLSGDADQAGNNLSTIQLSAPSHGSLSWNATGLAYINTLTSGVATNWQSDWSPDGSKLAFSSNRTGTYQIFVMNADGTNVVQLTNSGSSNTQPAWSPDGTKIAFCSDRSGTPQISGSWTPTGQGSSRLAITRLSSASLRGAPTGRKSPSHQVNPESTSFT